MSNTDNPNTSATAAEEPPKKAKMNLFGRADGDEGDSDKKEQSPAPAPRPPANDAENKLSAAMNSMLAGKRAAVPPAAEAKPAPAAPASPTPTAATTNSLSPVATGGATTAPKPSVTPAKKVEPVKAEAMPVAPAKKVEPVKAEAMPVTPAKVEAKPATPAKPTTPVKKVEPAKAEVKPVPPAQPATAAKKAEPAGKDTTPAKATPSSKANAKATPAKAGSNRVAPPAKAEGKADPAKADPATNDPATNDKAVSDTATKGAASETPEPTAQSSDAAKRDWTAAAAAAVGDQTNWNADPEKSWRRKKKKKKDKDTSWVVEMPTDAKADNTKIDNDKTSDQKTSDTGASDKKPSDHKTAGAKASATNDAGPAKTAPVEPTKGWQDKARVAVDDERHDRPKVDYAGYDGPAVLTAPERPSDKPGEIDKLRVAVLIGFMVLLAVGGYLLVNRDSSGDGGSSSIAAGNAGRTLTIGDDVDRLEIIVPSVSPNQSGVLEFDVRITNTGQVQKLVRRSDFSLSGPIGGYTRATTSQLEFNAASLAPGESVRGRIAFNVPPDAGGAELRVDVDELPTRSVTVF